MLSRIQHILCINNHKDTCDLLTALLQYHNQNYKVICTRFSEEAKALILTRHFDLYIIDSHLREIDGFQMCQWIRKFDSLTPIVFFSALGRSDDEKMAVEAGASAFLLKVRDIDKFAETADRLLSRSSRQKEV